MLKNSSTFAVCIPINLSTKLGCVTVNGSRETYFVDAPRITRKSQSRLLRSTGHVTRTQESRNVYSFNGKTRGKETFSNADGDNIKLDL